MGFIDTIRAKVELYRLEQRYARRDNRRTYASTAEYVDGEYVFHEAPVSPASSSNSTSWQSSGSGGSSRNNSKRMSVVRVKDVVSSRSVR